MTFSVCPLTDVFAGPLGGGHDRVGAVLHVGQRQPRPGAGAEPQTLSWPPMPSRAVQRLSLPVDDAGAQDDEVPAVLRRVVANQPLLHQLGVGVLVAVECVRLQRRRLVQHARSCGS